ncbi:MAG: iron-containing alcohol dehydrogenase [Oscillospiraceae bacterium]|jgi:alcohol dehydrogenase|nr:iron-containing alcohol dehydrogenase [Oscillospiraceae bacterium]
MIAPFEFSAKTRILFGAGKAARLGETLTQFGCVRPFLLTGSHVSRTAAFQGILQALGGAGIKPEVCAESRADPETEFADALAARIRAGGYDAVVAVGGGSVIDGAKAAAMLVTNGGEAKQYMFGGGRTVSVAPLTLIAVPTTAGSGSEVTSSSVLTDVAARQKRSITSPLLIPAAAIIDPETHVDMPASVTSTTGMDALTHALEAYVSRNANPVSDAFGEAAMRKIAASIETAVLSPRDLGARAEMAVAATLAGMAFTGGGLGAVHGISQAIGGLAHVAHGLGNALLLPHVMAVNLPGAPARFARIAELLGVPRGSSGDEEMSRAAVEAVRSLNARLNIPARLSEVGVTRAMFPRIIEEAMAYRLMPLNPVTWTEKDIENVLNSAF